MPQRKNWIGRTLGSLWSDAPLASRRARGRRPAALPFAPLRFEPLEPRRLYNVVVFVIVALMLAGVLHLLAAIVRDHKD